MSTTSSGHGATPGEAIHEVAVPATRDGNAAPPPGAPALAEFVDRLTQLAEAVTAARAASGDRWVTVERHRLPELASLAPAFRSLRLAKAAGDADRLAADADLLDRAAASLRDIAAVYRMPAPTDLDSALRLCELSAFAGEHDKPEAGWLTTDGLRAAQEAATALRDHEAAEAEAKDQATRYFAESAVEADGVAEVAERIRTVRRGLGFGKLSGRYRADRRFVAELTQDGSWHAGLPAHLPALQRWQQARADLQAARAERASALGATDTDDLTVHRLERLFAQAARIQRLGAAADPEALAAQVARGGEPSTAAHLTARETANDLRAWQDRLLAPDSGEPGPTADLAELPLAEAAGWLRGQADALHTIAGTAGTLPLAGTTEPTIAHVIDAYAATDAARERIEELAKREIADRELLGDRYPAELTDPEALRILDLATVAAIASRLTSTALPAARHEAAGTPARRTRTAPRRWSADYRKADVDAPKPLPAIQTKAAQPALRRVFLQVLAVEAPVHREVLHQRAREAWGLTRSGTRIKASLDEALRELTDTGKVRVDEEFVELAKPARQVARRPVPEMTRSVEQVPPHERRVALLGLLGDAPKGLSADALVRKVAGYFGWSTRGAAVARELDADVTALLAEELIGRDGDRLTLA